MRPLPLLLPLLLVVCLRQSIAENIVIESATREVNWFLYVLIATQKSATMM